jgi:hypothetical protein
MHEYASSRDSHLWFEKTSPFQSMIIIVVISHHLKEGNSNVIYVFSFHRDNYLSTAWKCRLDGLEDTRLEFSLAPALVFFWQLSTLKYSVSIGGRCFTFMEAIGPTITGSLPFPDWPSLERRVE